MARLNASGAEPVTPLKSAHRGVTRLRASELAGRAAFGMYKRMKRKRWPEIEQGLCLLLKPNRLRLPSIDIGELFDDADDVQVRLQRLPRGRWASPVTDLVALCKLVALAKPRWVLELGSFRGYATLGIAAHLGEDARVVSVDANPDHGEAYRGTPEEMRIERRTGLIGPDLFGPDDVGKYDLVFIDADHTYESVERDTGVALPLVSDHGWIVWHDYANWGFFSRACGVPEYLAVLARDRPIAHLSGTNMAISRRSWAQGPQRDTFLEAIRATRETSGGGPWADYTARP